MSRNFELDALKAKEQEAFLRKQEAFQRYAAAKDGASAAHDMMQSAWERRRSAREEMNREYEKMQESSEQYREIWNEYGRIRDANNARIESLRYEADSEHQMMKNCFERASAEYEYGDKSEAPIYSAEGHEHKERRDELNAKIGDLIQEIRDAKANAEWRAPKTDSSAFHRAKEMFNEAKAQHESAEREFKRLKLERDQHKAEFDSAQKDYLRLKEEFQAKLAEMRATKRRERNEILDRAGVGWSEREDAKIVKKADGTTQVYHGGVGSGDGFGHGHTALDQFGRKTYDRGAFEEHGKQNFEDENINNNRALAVGTDMLDGRPAKVRHRKDGRVDVFFVNSGNYGDGLGHGHAVIDKDGSIAYLRDQWQDKSQGQYLIDNTKDSHTKI